MRKLSGKRTSKIAIALTLVGLLGIIAAGGHAFTRVHGHPFKPHFFGISDRIRYHDSFVDGHSHSGNPGGFAGGHSKHGHTNHGEIGPARYAGTPYFFLSNEQRKLLTELIATGQLGAGNEQNAPITEAMLEGFPQGAGHATQPPYYWPSHLKQRWFDMYGAYGGR